MTSRTVEELQVGDRFVLAPGLEVELVEVLSETEKTRVMVERFTRCDFDPSRVGQSWGPQRRRRATILRLAR